MEQKHKNIRTLRGIFRLLAFISGGLGFLFFLIILIGGGTPETPRATSLLALLLGVIYLLVFFTVGEVLQLFADIEENTRQTKELLERK